MPNPPPRLTNAGTAPASSASRPASASVAACASMIAPLSSVCDPAKMWKPCQSAPAATSRRTSPGTRTASIPNGDARPPIRIPDPRSSKSGFTRTAIRGGTPIRSPIASARSASPSDSTCSVAPAAIAPASSSSRLPGPAKLIAAAGLTRSAMASSPPDATSRPSTSGPIACNSAACGLALIA